MKNRRWDDGFTLIETLVAMMLLAISLTMILQLFSGGLKSVQLSNHYTRAIFYAQEKMDEILLNAAIAEGVWEEELNDGFTLKAEVTDNRAEKEESEKMPVNLFDVNLTVRWLEGSREKRFELSTLKIVEKKE